MLVGADDFFRSRKERRLAEPAVLVFGGYDGFDCGANRVHRPMLSLVEGQWAFVSSPPAWSCAGDGDLYPVRVDDTRKKEKTPLQR